MKTTIKTFFLLICASAFLVACENCTNVTYSEPDTADAEWLVYGGLKETVAESNRNLKDTILFKDESGDTITYFRTGIYAQNTPGDGYSVDDDCIEQLNTQVTNVIEDASKQNPLLATFILRKPDALLVKIGVDRTGSWDIDPSSQELKRSVEINDSTYYNVYEITGSGTKDTDVKKIYFNKEYGFLEVEFNNSKKLSLLKIL